MEGASVPSTLLEFLHDKAPTKQRVNTDDPHVISRHLTASGTLSCCCDFYWRSRHFGSTANSKCLVSNAKHNRRNRFHHAASSSASGSGFSTPTATAAAPQILQPSAYHQPQQSRQQNFYSGNGGGAGVTSSSSSAAHRSTSPFQRPNSSANFQAGAAGGVPERYTESPFGGGGGTRAGGVDRTAHQLEGQNNERLEGLLGKVKLLKDVSCRGRRQAIEGGGGTRVRATIPW